MIQETIGSVPVVVMSASADGKERARRMDAEAFLVKPFDKPALGPWIALRAEAGQHAGNAQAVRSAARDR